MNPPKASAAPVTGRRSQIVPIVLWALGFRLVSALLAFLANIVFPLYQREQFTVFGRTHVFWDTFARYDSGWFHDIASHGYRYVAGGRSNLAFFPLYPLMMRYGGMLMGGRQEHYYFAGIAVSWVAFAVAMTFLHKVASLDVGEDRALRAPLYAAIFPFAFFEGLVYTESLFLAALVTSVYGFRTRRWWLAGFAGALATATRVNGILSVPALAWMAWQSAGTDRRQRTLGAVAVAGSTLGFVAYCLYVYWLSGSPFEWSASISRWAYYPGGRPWDVLVGLVRAIVTRPYSFLTTEQMAPYDLANGSAALVMIATLPFIWFRLGGPYGLFMLVQLWVPLSAGQLVGLGRYCAMLFPFFILLASLRSDWAHGMLVPLLAMLYMLCLAMFTTLHPIF